MLRWVFHDPQTSANYTVPKNPATMSFPTARRNLQTLPLIAGRMPALAAPPQPPDIQFQGWLAGQTHHDTLLDWVAKEYAVQITDHLSRTWTVLLSSFEMTSRRGFGNDWYRGTYVIKGFAL